MEYKISINELEETYDLFDNDLFLIATGFKNESWVTPITAKSTSVQAIKRVLRNLAISKYTDISKADADIEYIQILAINAIGEIIEGESIAQGINAENEEYLSITSITANGRIDSYEDPISDLSVIHTEYVNIYSIIANGTIIYGQEMETDIRAIQQESVYISSVNADGKIIEAEEQKTAVISEEALWIYTIKASGEIKQG